MWSAESHEVHLVDPSRSGIDPDPTQQIFCGWSGFRNRKHQEEACAIDRRSVDGEDEFELDFDFDDQISKMYVSRLTGCCRYKISCQHNTCATARSTKGGLQYTLRICARQRSRPRNDDSRSFNHGCCRNLYLHTKLYGRFLLTVCLKVKDVIRNSSAYPT